MSQYCEILVFFLMVFECRHYHSIEEMTQQKSYCTTGPIQCDNEIVN